MARVSKAGSAYIELFINDSKLVRGLKSASKDLQQFSSKVGNIGKSMMAVSAAMAAPFAGGVKIFADFETQMAAVATMLQNPEEHMENFKEGVRSLSVQFGESTETLSKGLYDILSASIAPSKALGVLEVAARAGAAGLSDTATAADAITTILNSYGLSAERAGDVSDWLFTIVQRGKTDFGQLAPQVGKVASIASAAGLSLDEFGAALATMTRSGVKTDSAITSLAAIIQAFLAPSSEAIEYAKSLGINLNSATLQAEGLEGIFEKISQLPPDAISKLFPSITALKGVMPALKNLDGFKDDMAAMAGRAGATQKAYANFSGTLNVAFARLRQTAIQALSVIGEALAPIVGKVAEKIQQVASAVVSWLKANKELVVTVAGIIAGIGAVGALLVSIAGAASALSMVFSGLSTASAIVVGAFTLIGKALVLIVSPIGLIIGALAALGGYFLYTSGAGAKAIDYLAEKFESLKERALTSFAAIKDAIAAGDISLAVKVLWTAIKAEFIRGITPLKNYWIDFKEFILVAWNDAVYGVLNAANNIWGQLKILWNNTIAGMTKAMNKFSAYVKSVWTNINGWVEELFTRMLLFMDGFDAKARDAAAKEIRTRVSNEDAQTWDAYEKAAKEIDTERDTRNNQIESDLKTDRDAYSAAADESRNQIQSQYDMERKAADDALSAAKQEWIDAVDAARKAREAADNAKAEKEAASDPTTSPIEPLAPSPIGDIGDMLGGLTESINQAAKTLQIGTLGTFNTAAIRGLQGGSAADRTAAATEETAKNTRKIVDGMADNGLAFA